jgi:hypothetical protein
MKIGVSHVRAAVAAGVSDRTLYRWLKKGEDDETAGSTFAGFPIEGADVVNVAGLETCELYDDALH